MCFQVHLTNKPILSKLVQLSPVIQGTLVQGLDIHAFHQDEGTEVPEKDNPHHRTIQLCWNWLKM